MRQIIALVGFQSSGKDTVGRLIQDSFPQFKLISFAQPIKDSLSSMFGWERTLLEGLTPESRTWRETLDPFWSQHLQREITPRLMMRTFGTELIRNHLHQKFWTLSLQKTLMNSDESFVVTDTRFLNEIQMLRELGGKTVWVRRDPLPHYYSQALWLNQQRPLVQRLASPFLQKIKGVHRSEREWIGERFDHTLVNNGSIADLRHQVIEWINTHGTTKTR
jgi:hypothetical protein